MCQLATSHLSHAPQHHTAAGLQWDYCSIWLSYSGTLVYASGLQYQRAVVWGQLTLNFGRFRASMGALTCHVTPLSRAPTSLGRWSAVGLLSFLVVIFGHSCLCFWAAVSASRCVGAADFEIWQVPSECGHVNLPRHASLTCPNITQPLVCSGTTVLSGCHIWALSSMLLGCGISKPLCGGKLTLNFGRF